MQWQRTSWDNFAVRKQTPAPDQLENYSNHLHWAQVFSTCCLCWCVVGESEECHRHLCPGFASHMPLEWKGPICPFSVGGDRVPRTLLVMDLSSSLPYLWSEWHSSQPPLIVQGQVNSEERCLRVSWLTLLFDAASDSQPSTGEASNLDGPSLSRGKVLRQYTHSIQNRGVWVFD